MRQDNWLLYQLPVGMVGDHLPIDGPMRITDETFFVRYMSIFQTIADSVMQQVDTLPHMFDPTVAPDQMVRAMAAWIGVDWIDSSLDETLQRKILTTYSEFIPWRGTRRGMEMLLGLLTDGNVDAGEIKVTDSGGVYARDGAPKGPPHVRIDVASTGWTRRDDLIRIVRDEMPASVTFEMYVAGDRVWPIQRAASALAPPDPATAAVADQVGSTHADR